tara:strand:- start:7202 stop:8485 length:1284 start_codon:yes stop_codon:yes gene_type:complete
MIKATMVGQTMICVIGGKLYQKSVDTDSELIEIYKQALNTDEDNPQELKLLKDFFEGDLTNEEQREKEEFEKDRLESDLKKSLTEWMDDIKKLGDEHFEVNGIKLYMKGIGITIPEFLAAEFAIRRNNGDDLKSMMNFWRLCALNPDPRCREDLYKFLINNHMVVTPSGYFLAYRNANVKEKGNRELNEFVADQYVKLKSWKKSTKNHIVLENMDDGESKYFIKAESLLEKFYARNEGEFNELGTVEELYNDVILAGEHMTMYTDAHSGTTKIALGQPVSIPRNDCDADPDRTCSRGLHLGSTNFMTKGYFGSVGLVCLCNPMHVVAVPYTDGQKLRTSEYLPIGIAEYGEDNKLIPVQTATFEYEYAEHTDEQLEEMLNNTRFESLKDHKIIPQELTYEDFRDMVSDFSVSTDEMNKAIQGRVINL